jgi:branched-chain amino acid aminotransferase
MAPSAIPATPPEGVKTAELTAAAVSQKIELAAHLQPLDASKLKFTKTTTPMTVPEPADPIIATSSQCTDHMVSAVWKSTTGWQAPELHPYRNLSIAPTASVLHYATECFEGMKMYRGYDGKLRLFRPDCNCKRMVSKSPINDVYRAGLITF